MAENKQYISQVLENGSVQISEDVFTIIVANAIKDVEGVVGLSVKTGSDLADMIGMKAWGKGIKITLDENGVQAVECNINIAYGQTVVDVAKNVQQVVISALEGATGMKDIKVKVNVCGIIRQ